MDGIASEVSGIDGVSPVAMAPVAASVVHVKGAARSSTLGPIRGAKVSTSVQSSSQSRATGVVSGTAGKPVPRSPMTISRRG